MEAIILQAKNKAEVKFWLELAKKTGTCAKAIDTKEMEDKSLAALIEKGMKTGNLSRENVMKALGR